MRVCLLYSGFLRTWAQCQANHLENINKALTDAGHEVYAVWFSDFDPFPQGKWDYYYRWTKIPETIFYPDGFAPHPYDTNKSPEGNVYQTLRQWQGNFVTFSIAPSDFDVYVRIRPDLKFNGPLTIQKPEPQTVYIPEGSDFRGINDQFAYGDYETMKAYFQVFENYHFLFAKGTMFNSEVMQLANLQDKNINIVRYGSPQHDIIR